MTQRSDYPIRRVEVVDTDFFKPPAGGSSKVFGEVNDKVRSQLSGLVLATQQRVASRLSHLPKGAAAVARIKLKSEALAKTHHPTELLEKSGCHQVGVGHFGELLLSVDHHGLGRLSNAILSLETKRGIANISTIEHIDEFRPNHEEVEVLTERLSRGQTRSVKLRAFHHGSPLVDRAMNQALHAILEATEVEWTELNYARGRRIFRLANATPAAVAQLAEFVGTESVGEFPEFGLVRPSNTPVAKLQPSALSPPKKGIHYPIVGVVDSGTREDDPFLSPWRVAREQYVPTTNSDYDHGTFVSALVVGAKQLNQGHPEFPASQCKFVDVVAVPSGGRVSEDELVAILREVIPKYPDVKVWNMSLAGSVPCSDFCFSDFGAALDEIQQDYGVVIVLPSGNFSSSPYRSWPPPPEENDRDRICAPADSVHALCVGSTTHLDSPSALSPKGAPSPFAKRGPGPAFLPKPEVTHYGGNCDANGNHAQVGVLSLDPSGNLVEGIGTSYSTPIVSSILASIQSGAETPLSPLLSRALLIHSTVLKNEGTSPEHFRFTGYGKAPDPDFALSCTASSATLVFEAEIEAGTDLSRVPFAVPACLKNDSGALRGTITATLVTQTSIDPARGAEYCRNNVDVSLGVIRKNSNGEPKFTGQLKTYPKPAAANHRERQLVENGQKWSPVKVYRKRIARGVSGEAWRLLVAGTDRQGEPPGMVKVALVITIEDPDGKAPVYNDVVTSMNSLGWISTPINLRERSRVG